MTELTVVRGPGKGTSITLTPDRSVSIGAAAEAEIRVVGDGVAAEQLVVKALRGGGFGAKGLAGAFLLNGTPTEAARLRDGDVLRVGDTEIRFRDAPGDAGVREIGGFRLLGVLGKGGWGTVWRAEQKSLGREVALKVLSADRTNDPLFVGRFQAEARNAARLHHPNVVQVFDVDHDGDTWFYSMELMHGGSLEQRLRQEGKLPVEEAIRVVRDAAKGLAFAEQMRIVHRDIKPDNLMVDRHDHVKIADLGLAMTDDDELDKLVGTPHFMSPEQVRKQPLDHRSDLYSLGCTFYRLVTGRTPFQGDNVKQILRAHLEEAAPAPQSVEPAVPAAVGQVIERLMSKDPAARHQSATELIEDLDQLLAPPTRRGLWIAVVAAVVVAAAAIVTVTLLNRPDPQQPTKVVEYRDDPEAQKALEEKRRVEAENALLRVRMRGLEGVALADALDEMAKEHPETPASRQAAEQATRLREDAQQRAELEARRKARVDAAVAGLCKAFEAALAAGDLPAASGAIRGAPEDPEIGDAPALLECRAELARRLRAAADERLAALRAEVDTAVTSRDPSAVRSALAPIDALLGPGGWPAELLADRETLQGYASERRARADALDKELAEEAQADAWASLSHAVLDPDGIAARIRALRFDDAAARLEDVAKGQAGFVAATRAAELAPALRAAGRYLARFAATVGGGGLEIVDPRSGESVPVAGFALGSGITLKTGPRIRPREEVVPLAEMEPNASSWFVPLGTDPDPERAAFLGALALARNLDAARRYLAGIRPDDDTSGVGEDGYQASNDGLVTTLAALDTETSEPWAKALATELRATALLARALSAFAARRNLTAAGLLDRLLAEHGGTLVVRCLR